MKKIGVIGAGLMGTGIAQTCAQAGLDVVLCDIDIAIAEQAKAKIGKQFARLVEKEKLSAADADAALVQAIVQMAQTLGLKTIAEGVETDRQERFLRDQGCDEIQGFYRSKPLPPKEFEAYFHSLMSGAIIS